MERPTLAAAPADIAALGVRGPWSLGAGPDILNPGSVRPDSPFGGQPWTKTRRDRTSNGSSMTCSAS
ncbi:hypothetical protein THIOKS12740017 [Thiocapsa sp. KS1]|nr:hypothetical protein THIOKS12740017 [Thiocapsa sp. KS1]